MSHVVVVENEEGAFLAEGPYDDEETAQARADLYRASLRLASYKADPREYSLPDDPPIFAWVVRLVPSGTEIDNPFAEEPIELIDATMDLHVVASVDDRYESGRCNDCGQPVMRRVDGFPDQTKWGVALANGGVYGSTNCAARQAEAGDEEIPHLNVTGL